LEPITHIRFHSYLKLAKLSKCPFGIFRQETCFNSIA
jgi:hypothetical protein